MKKRILPLLLAAALALTGCASLLERSYTLVEPYTDRYWDTGAEDTLRAESYQDLVNSLLMLVEQRAGEGVIRYYTTDTANVYNLAADAQQEVQKETVLGAYLLDGMSFTFSGGDAYCTLTFTMTYREEAGDPESLMVLSDTQSLVDLLRLAVRESHDMLTARFFDKTPREDVEAAVMSLWQELWRDEMAQADPPEALPPADEETTGEEGETTAEDSETADAQTPSEEIPSEQTEGGDAPPEADAGTSPEDATGQPPEDPAVPDVEDPAQPSEEAPAELPVRYPPCPWTIRFYPNQNSAEIVEILLSGADENFYDFFE